VAVRTRLLSLMFVVLLALVIAACGVPIGGGKPFAGDRAWADTQIAKLKGRPTAGALYTSATDRVGGPITSNEQDALFGLAHQYLSESRLLLPNVGKQVAGHVEPKAAALMRQRGLTHAVLVINHTDPDGQGFCLYASGIGCQQAVEVILPKGSKLQLWWPSGGPNQAEGGGA
jgi:hypothetical protein